MALSVSPQTIVYSFPVISALICSGVLATHTLAEIGDAVSSDAET